MTGALGRWLRAFGRFWWDFLVGDTPELALGVLVLVALTVVLGHRGPALAVCLPALVVALLVASTLRGRRRAG